MHYCDRSKFAIISKHHWSVADVSHHIAVDRSRICRGPSPQCARARCSNHIISRHTLTLTDTPTQWPYDLACRLRQ